MMDHYNKPYEYKFLPWEKNVNSKTEYLPLYTNIAPEFVNITQDVRRFVREYVTVHPEIFSIAAITR